MKFNISMPDELFEHYVVKYGLPNAYTRMRQAIEICKDIEASDRVVLIAGDNRRAIEAVFQTTADSAEKLVKLIQNMNTVQLGNVEMSFSEDQLQRLKAQAGFHGRTIETYIRETVDELKAAMLERV
jgi:hypothetical protein